MDDRELASSFAFSLGMIAALAKEISSRESILQDFEDHGVSRAHFENLYDAAKELSKAYYVERKEKP